MDSIGTGASMTRDGEVRLAPPLYSVQNQQTYVPGIPMPRQQNQFGHRHYDSNAIRSNSGNTRAPLHHRRILQRQNAQMARQRESYQRWLADQHQRAYQQQQQTPVINASENVAAAAAAAAYRTAAAAAVAAAAAAATASGFMYPGVYAAMPAQPLILDPATTTVITQMTVAGPPLQLVQPQEVVVERVFAPATATAQAAAVISRNGNGRTVMFRPQPSNTTAAHPSFAPYVLVDNGHYRNAYQRPQQHFHQAPPQQWMAGAISLRQLTEFVDLPQGATQRMIDQCTRIDAYRSPVKAVPIGEEDKCAICLSEFETSENVRILPCAHFFHVQCIDRWLLSNKNCPVCRLSIDRDLQKRQQATNQ